MLGCNRQSRTKPLYKPIADDYNFLSPLLADADDELSPLRANG
jgi:hypothetical protein